MRLRDLAVVGLASTSSGRRVRPRQLETYDNGNSTDSTVTAIVYSTATVTENPPPVEPPTYESDTVTPIIVAPVPYSSPAPPPSSYGTTVTTTAIEYATGTSVVSVVSPTIPAYTSQKYSYAPSAGGFGTAPSEYTSVGTTVTSAYVVTGAPSPPPPPPGPPRPHRPVNWYGPNATNETCHGATLNVLDASLDWWYTKTLYHAVSTFSIQFNKNDSSTGWSLLPATTTFNVESALASPDCTSTQTFNPSLNASQWVEVTCTPAASPVAAETTIITQTAYREPNATTGRSDLPPGLIVTPTPASISVSDAEQAPYAQGTPFVFFSEYEIVTKSLTTYGNGRVGCAEATQTYTMEDAFSFEYTGGNVNGSLLVNEGVVGDVNPALLGLVGQDTAVAGSWVAEPTVVLLMQEVMVAEAALAATMEPSAPSLDVPSPTRPPFVTLAPTGPGGPPKITASGPRVEETQTELIVPTRLGDDNRPTGAAEQNQGGSGGGNPGPDEDNQGGNGGGNGQNQGGNGGSNNQPPPQGGVGNLIDAINSAAHNMPPPSPTNALEVLEQAAQTFPGANPTANAILNGIGGPGEAQEQNLPGGGSPVTVGGAAVMTPNGQGGFVVGNGQTLTPGGAVVVDGTTMSLGPDASAVVVNGVTQTLPSRAQATGGSAITVGGAIITPNSRGEYNLGDGQVLRPGGVAVVDGTTVSMDSAATAVVINGVTQTFGSPAQATGPDIPLITVGGAAVTPNAATEYSIAPDATLTPGGRVVVDGTTMSLDISGTALVVDGVTRTLASPAGAFTAGGDGDAAAGTTRAPILTIGDHTYHAINGGTTYVIDGETLTMGDEETVTIDGTGYQVSLSPEATRLLVETEDANGQVTATSTQTLFPEQGSGSGARQTASLSSSGGPEQQVGNAAATISPLLSYSGITFAFGSLFLAIWL